MGNLQKVTKGHAANIVKEIERTPEQGRKFDPEKHAIDMEKTHLNYSTLTRDLNSLEYLNKRLSEVKVQNRADVNVLGQWVWTVPKDLPEEFHKEFFQGITDYYREKHGEENICYARVHLDETTPHMHLGIIPVVLDQKKNRYKCCAKEVFTRDYMQHAHSDLQEYLEQRLGREVNLLNGASLGVDSISDFKKAKELTKEVAELSKTAELLREEVQQQQEILEVLNQEIKEKQSILNKLKETISDLRSKVRDTIEHFREHPNFYNMFLKWLNPRSTSEERQEMSKKYEQHLNDLHQGLSR